MTKVVVGDGVASFKCPGCGEVHESPLSFPLTPQWGFNGDADAPTFQPPLRSRSGHYAADRGPGNCWCDYEERTGEPPPRACTICHAVVTAGRIQFLDDCTHELAGQTVDLPEYPPAEQEPS